MTNVKVVFESDEGTESLWAAATERGYVLQNCPFYLMGVSFEDEVEAEPAAPGIFRYIRTIQKSPHSVYRVLFENHQDRRATELLDELFSLGCKVERGQMDGEILVAVHIPGTTDMDAVYSIFKAGLNEGTWEFEVAEDRHPQDENGPAM